MPAPCIRAPAQRSWPTTPTTPQRGAQRLLLGNGYRPAFTVVGLSRRVDGPAPTAPAELPAGLAVLSVRPGHQRRIHAAIEECFHGSGHGFRPLDYPGYLAGVRDTDLWIVAWDGADLAGLIVAPGTEPTAGCRGSGER